MSDNSIPQIEIDDELKSLIPPLSADEYSALETSLKAHGCRDALTVWGNTLVDGHNRYEICTRLQIPYTVKKIHFDDKTDAIMWMIQNQFARRNLTPFARAELIAKSSGIVERLKAEARERQLSALNKGVTSPVPSNLTEREKQGETRDTLAKMAEVSAGTFHKVQVVTEHAPETIKSLARQGDISTDNAYKITRALQGASDEIQKAVERHKITAPETVEILKDLQKNGRESYRELIDSEYIQLGDEEEAVHITASPLEIKKALEEKSRIHRQINGVPSALQSSEGNEWYTPSEFIESARKVMGSIDIDPASCEFANRTVKASKFFTIETNGFVQAWRGNVWLNPPYGRDGGESNQGLWSAKLIEKYLSGEVQQAILLVNAVTDRQWFFPFWDYPICFTKQRIRFYAPSGESGQPTHGNALIYFGANKQAFADEFSQYGAVVLSVQK